MSDLFMLRNAIRDLLRPKRYITAVLVAILPAFIAVMRRLTAHPDYHRHIQTVGNVRRHHFDPAHPEMLYNGFSSHLVFGFVLVIMAVVFGTGVVAQEIEQKTISYLLTRPVARWRILFIKYAVIVCGTAVTAWTSCLLLGLATYGPGKLGRSPVPLDLAILSIGALAYCSLFVCLSTVFNRALIIGLIYTFGWESWIPNLPGNFQKLSILAYLSVLSPHWDRPPREMVISATLAWTVLFSVIVFGALGAMRLFSTREYVPKDDAE